jgi:hypothetical protein
MVSVLGKGAVDCGYDPDRVKPKTIKLEFVASPPRMHAHERTPF